MRRTKVACGVCSNRSAPPMPPTRLMALRTPSTTRSREASSLRYAPTLATEPGQRATVLVALALIGGTPVKMSAGKEIKLPPPATEFNAPPNIAAKNRMTRFSIKDHASLLYVDTYVPTV